MEKIKEISYVIFITIVSTLVSGYYFAVSDQEIFIPYIYKIQDPALFENDLLFSQFTANASVFYQIIAELSEFINLEVLFLIGFLVCKFLFFLGVYLIAIFIFKKRETAFLSLLPFLFPKFIGGTATLTYDTFFGYRSVGIVFLSFFLLFVLKNQFIKASAVAALGLFFHPLSIIPNLLLATILIIKNSFQVKQNLIIFISLISISAILYSLVFKTGTNFFQSSTEWLSIIKGRDDYLFLSLWGIMGWFSLGLYLTLVALFFKASKSPLKQNIIVIIGTSLFLFAVNFVLLEILKLPIFTKFQLIRSITPIAIIGLVVSPSLLLLKNRKQKFFGFISFVSLCLNLYWILLISLLIQSLFILMSRKKFDYTQGASQPIIIAPIIIAAFLLSAFYFKNTVEFPKKESDWVKMQKWVHEETPKSAQFLVPPDQTGFRIFSKRSIIGDIKDGAVVIYSYQYATSWSNVMSDLAGYQEKDEENFISLKEKYKFDFLIVKTNHNLNFKKIYSNNSYIIYEI